MERAFVISLPRRAERLRRFMQSFEASGLTTSIHVQHVVATDGRRLELDASMLRRIRPVNLERLNELELRGVVGCALSHLEVWRLASAETRPVFVFEDDAVLLAPEFSHCVAQVPGHMPMSSSIVWLNDYLIHQRSTIRYRFERRINAALPALSRAMFPPRLRFAEMPDVLTTSEAYVLRPEVAGELYEAYRDDLGAVDRHIMQFVASRRASATQTDPPLFTQADRQDSDTGGRAGPGHALTA